jgi:hypothetical protein
LRIFLRSGSNGTILAQTVFAALPTLAYSVRFRAVGSSLMAKAWRTGAPEPANWMATASDSTIAAGICGIRATFNNGPRLL